MKNSVQIVNENGHMKVSEEYESIVLNSIIEHLRHTRNEEQKPYFPIDLDVFKTLTVCDYTINDNVIKIESINEASALMVDLINGNLKVSVNKSLEIMCMLWNSFFGSHYKKWDTSTEEWAIANTWYMWIKDYSWLCLEDVDKYKKYLDCTTENIQKADEVTLGMKIHKEEKKEMLNEVFNIFVLEPNFHKLAGVQLIGEDAETLYTIFAACLGVLEIELLENYQFQKICMGKEPYVVTKEEKTIFNGITMSKERRIYYLSQFQKTKIPYYYKIIDDKLYLLKYGIRIIESDNLISLTRFIARCIQRSYRYWMGKQIQEYDYESISKKIGINALTPDILKKMYECIDDCIFKLNLKSDFVRVRKRRRHLSNEEIESIIEANNLRIRYGINRVVRNRREDDYKQKVKEKMEWYRQHYCTSRLEELIIQTILEDPYCSDADLSYIGNCSYSEIRNRINILKTRGLLKDKIYDKWIFDVNVVKK